MNKAKIKFWGVRGSLARPGKNTLRYGGNTPCLEIRYGHELLIIDAGTGIYGLGSALAKFGEPIKAAILFSHYHWDHLVGLPFFLPAYNKKNSFIFIGRKNLKTALSKLLTPPNFPVTLSDFKAKISFKTKKPGKFKIGSVLIEAFEVNHPNGAFGYRFTFPNGKNFVHISDNGPAPNDDNIIKKISGASFLIHDAQYLPKEYLRRKMFGHSPYHYSLDLARRAGVKNVVLFHHDPSRADGEVRKIEKSAKKLGRKIGLLKITAAREGMEITL